MQIVRLSKFEIGYKRVAFKKSPIFANFRKLTAISDFQVIRQHEELSMYELDNFLEESGMA